MSACTSAHWPNALAGSVAMIVVAAIIIAAILKGWRL